MKLNRILILMLLISSSTGLNAAAFGTQSNLPIDISADRGDSALGDGVTILRKNVHIKQGQLEIIAELGKIHTSNSKVVRIELEGSPVTWHQELPEGGVLDAQANTINYQVAQALIVLTGNVQINHPQGEIKGHQVRYDLTRERFLTQSSGGDDRVHFRIIPAEKKPVGIKTEEQGVNKPSTSQAGAASDQKDSGNK
ncbi:MAG: lipopolysaccharide transport periplasmic protein LptA [Proteobacteria bacterium]|nr:lipopolysaccharide transport periplasmic protein LptA [Pseudomonadota bacterium]